MESAASDDGRTLCQTREVMLPSGKSRKLRRKLDVILGNYLNDTWLSTSLAECEMQAQN